MRKRKFASSDNVNDVFIVETICKKKIRSNKEPLYFIKWKDWDDKYNTWEPQSNILDKSLIDIFEEEQKEKIKVKKENIKSQDLNVSKEVEFQDSPIESKDIIVSNNDKMNEKVDVQNELDKSIETELRPKICLKIPKHRIHAPCIDIGKKLYENDFHDRETEKKKSQNIDIEIKFSSKLSPTYFSNEESMNTLLNGNSNRGNKLSHKPDFHWSKHSQIHSDKSVKSSDLQIHKPRKLLSINDYSAKMKKHHKKSKQEKHKSEETRHLKDIYKNQNEVSIENKSEKKPESKAVRQQHERPLVALENQIETWSEKSMTKDIFSEPIKGEEIKQVAERFKYHANTIVTDVTVRNLSVTIREMPYEDFIDNDDSRYLMVRVPVQSDWLTRYRGSSKEILDEIDSEIEEVEQDIREIACPIKTTNSDKKQQLLERFTESIIPGLRPPSRPRSVDSYKAAIDKNFSGSIRNPFSTTHSPVKISTECQVQSTNMQTCTANKSPLQIIIDDCEEVDVVGGIESDHSFVGSLQSESVTVSTQIRQALPVNTSPVTSIIQSLLQSYSYNQKMMMPPLQAAPWIEPHNQHNQLIYQIPRRNSGNVTLLSSNEACMPPGSIEPGVLKYTENACLLYRQPTGLLSDIYVSSSQDTPIDLSFK